MKIEITMGNTIQMTVTMGGQRFSPELTEDIIGLFLSISDYVQSVKPQSDLDKAIKHIVSTADESVILEMKSLFPRWTVGVNVGVGEVLEFNSDLYQVIQAHRTQLDWLPPDVPALYTRIVEPGTVGAWRQPQGAHDAYQMGDKVTHKDETWESTADDNVWEPGVYGWTITT